MKIRPVGGELFHVDGRTDMTKLIMKLEFSRQFFRKNSQISNFMKIHPVGGELFHVDGRTDGHDEANNEI